MLVLEDYEWIVLFHRRGCFLWLLLVDCFSCNWFVKQTAGHKSLTSIFLPSTQALHGLFKRHIVPSIPVSWLCETLCGTTNACSYSFTIFHHSELLLCLCFGGLLGKCQWCSQTEGHNVNLNFLSNNSTHVTTVQAYSTVHLSNLKWYQGCCVYLVLSSAVFIASVIATSILNCTVSKGHGNVTQTKT